MAYKTETNQYAKMSVIQSYKSSIKIHHITHTDTDTVWKTTTVCTTLLFTVHCVRQQMNCFDITQVQLHITDLYNNWAAKQCKNVQQMWLWGRPWRMSTRRRELTRMWRTGMCVSSRHGLFALRRISLHSGSHGGAGAPPCTVVVMAVQVLLPAQW